MLSLTFIYDDSVFFKGFLIFVLMFIVLANLFILDKINTQVNEENSIVTHFRQSHSHVVLGIFFYKKDKILNHYCP